MTDENTTLRRAFGLADAFELLAAATPFPGDDLAGALADGTLADDALGCLVDAGIAEEEAEGIVAPLEGLRGSDAAALATALRRAHSLILMRQGRGVALWPYEAAFLHVEAGKPGEPALFRAPTTLAVEDAMRDAGMLPADSRVEPCDSIWDECAFVARLLGCQANALAMGDDEGARAWGQRAQGFLDGHGQAWMPGFFAALGRLAGSEAVEHLDAEARAYYGFVGAYGQRVLALAADAR